MGGEPLVEKFRSGSCAYWVVAVCVAALGHVSCSSEPPVAETETTRDAMQEIFEQLQILLPAAVQGELGAPERAKEIGTSFEQMQRRVEALPEHGNGLDPGARLFGRALSRDVRRAREFFDRGRFDSAAFIVESLVDDCTACHTRRPADDSLITQGFVEQSDLERLEALERAAIAVATRQFDDAMERYERLLREPGGVAEMLLSPIVRYLTVALRVSRDPARAKKLLDQYATHPNLPPVVQKDIEHWNQVLGGLSAEDFAGTTLARAREAIVTADGVAQYPGDQRALIEFLIASAQLHDLVAFPQDSPDAAAEIYELLGRAELGISQSVWLSRADLYWETAIRLAPESPGARRALARLEKETHAGFTGSGGLQLPAEEESRLADLRALVMAEKPTPMEVRAGEHVGARLFANHCAFCHGPNAEGRGVGTELLMSVPEDLTRIAARRDGAFPEAEVFALIARRDPLGNHQSPEMPRWGEFWEDDGKIEALVEYLRSIQQP